MKARSFLLPLVIAAIMLSASYLSSCHNDKIHSATDGGNVGEVKNSAKNSDTSSTPNVMADSLRH